MRDKTLILRCSVCKEENYTTIKNYKTTTEKLELKKYCPRCNASVLHVEKK